MSLEATRKRITNLQIKEISSVDRPAQHGAIAVLMKRADEREDILKNAAAVVTSGSKPTYSVADYEDAMFARAGEIATAQGCTPEQAFAKCLSTDTALRTLAHACEYARHSAHVADVRKRQPVGTL